MGRRKTGVTDDSPRSRTHDSAWDALRRIVPGLALCVQRHSRKSWVLRYSRAAGDATTGWCGYPRSRGSRCPKLARGRRAGDALARKGWTRHRGTTQAQRPCRRPRRAHVHAVRERYVAAHEAGWKQARHGPAKLAVLKTYAGRLGSLRVITSEWRTYWTHSRRVMRAAATAKKLRLSIEAVLDFASARANRSGENPHRDVAS